MNRTILNDLLNMLERMGYPATYTFDYPVLSLTWQGYTLKMDSRQLPTDTDVREFGIDFYRRQIDGIATTIALHWKNEQYKDARF